MKLFIIMVLVLVGVSVAEAQEVVWKMAVVKSSEGSYQSQPFFRPLKFHDGDRFQLLIIPEAKCQVLVIYEDTAGNLRVVYRHDVNSGKVILVPGKDESFQVSPPDGNEKFHIIVASQLPAVLTDDLKALPESSNAVLNDVANLQASADTLAESAEKPVPMGGTERGLKAVALTRFSGQNLYVRTIRFHHE